MKPNLQSEENREKLYTSSGLVRFYVLCKKWKADIIAQIKHENDVPLQNIYGIIV